MSSFFRVLLLCAILAIGANAFAQIHIVNFDFGAVQIACGSDYAYQGPEGQCPYQNFNTGPGFGWVLGAEIAAFGPYFINGGPGLTGPNTAFAPPSFEGLPFNQALFLQNISFAAQRLEGFSAGSYVLSFYLGSRYASGPDGNQTVLALIDGHVIGTWVLSSYTPFTLQTATFNVSTGGSHTLMLEGTNDGDHTAFLSYVVITPTEH